MKKRLLEIIKKTLLSFVFFMSFLTFGCNKTDDAELVAYYNGLGEIMKFGNESEGDCGYYIVLDSANYKPTVLPGKYQIIGLKVNVKLKTTGDTLFCGDLATYPHSKALPNVKIIDISAVK